MKACILKQKANAAPPIQRKIMLVYLAITAEGNKLEK